MSTDIVQGDFVEVQSALESSLGTQATSGWATEEPNAISDAYPNMKHVTRNPISGDMMKRKGAVVGLGSAPKLTMDLSRYVLERYGTQLYRSATKYPGGTGAGRFAVGDGTLTAVTGTAYTVSANGALPDGVLVYAEGFSTAGNNGLKVLAGTSTGTSIKTSGLTAEASPPATAVLYVVGYQGAAGDIAINASLNLTSAATVFASLGIQAGSFGWLGGATAASPGLLGFTTAGNRGFFRFKTVAAGTITVDRRTQSWTAEAGGSQTIQIFFGPWWRNVPGTHSDYLEPSRSIELAYPGAGAADAVAYAYALGACLNEAKITAGSEDKVVVEMSFVGVDFTAASTTRATGADTPLAVIGTGALTTADQVKRIRLSNASDETAVSTDVIDWSLTIKNNIKPQVQQGTLGAKRMVFGKHDEDVELTVVCVDTKPWEAIRADTTVAFDVALRGTDCTALFDVPAADPMGGAPNIRENEVVTLPLQGEGHKDPTVAFVGGLTLFPYLPAT